MKDNSDKKNTKLYWGAGILIAALLITGFVVYYPWAAIPTDTTVKANSTFTLIDYRTGEDVTEWVEISVWTPDADDLPFDDEDPYIITNFDEEISSSDAADVEIDLRADSDVWVEIDPDFESDYGGYNGVFNALATRDMRKIPGTGGGSNYDYYIYVYHAPSNVSVAMLDRGDMDAVDGSGADRGTMAPYNNTFVVGAPGAHWNRGVDGNYTVFFNMPLYSKDGLHAGVVGGDEWEIDDEEHDDMSQAEIAWLRDQKNFRTIAPYYDLTDDVNKDFSDDMEKITNAFAFRIRFNETISTTDGQETQVNLTIMERDYNSVPAEVIVDGEYIWIVFYEPITCYDESYNFDIELEFGAHIFLANATTVRVIVPDDDDNLGAATVLNTMFLDIYDQYA